MGKYLQGNTVAQLRRLGYMDASVDTSENQLVTRLRLAEANHTNPKFRDYLENLEGRKEVMVECANRIYTHGLKCANAVNKRRLDRQDVKDWLRGDFIASWKKHDLVSTDVHQYMNDETGSCLLGEAPIRPARLVTRITPD